MFSHAKENAASGTGNEGMEKGRAVRRMKGWKDNEEREGMKG